MNQSRSIAYTSMFIIGVFTLAISFSLFCLYKSLTGISIKGRADVQTATLLASMREKLRIVKSQKEAELILKSLDGVPSNIMSSNKIADIRKAYGISNSGSLLKDTVFDSNEITRAELEVVNQTFNFYRQQMVKRNLAVASILSSLLNDAHTVLLKDQRSEVIQAYLRKAKDQVQSIKNMAKGFSDSDIILEKARQLDQNLLILLNITKQQSAWEKSREEIFKSADQIISSFLSDISQRLENNVDYLQRDFLLAVFLFLVALLASILFSNLIGKRAAAWFHQKSALLSKYLLNFGKDEDQNSPLIDYSPLLQDSDWGFLLGEVKKAEEKFRNKSSAEISLSKSITSPFVVFSPLKKAVYWNSYASRILDISSKDEIDEIAMDDFFSKCGLIKKKENFSELMQQMEGGNEIYLHIHTRNKNEIIPIEVGLYPIRAGLLKGGFIVAFWEMKEEERRVTERILSNYAIVDKIVDAILNNKDDTTQNVDWAQVPEQVVPLIEKLKKLRVKLEEREKLWHTEIEAIWSQAKKEEDILQRFTEELNFIKQKHDSVSALSESISDFERTLSSFSIEVERQVSEGQAQWDILKQDLQNKTEISHRAQEYEFSVRALVKEMRVWRENLRDEVFSVKKCKDWVQLHAINMNLQNSSDPEIFRARAKKFAVSISEFYERLEKIETEIQNFIDRHPGATSVPMMDAGVDVKSMVNGINNAYATLSKDLEEWRITNAELKNLSNQSHELSQAITERKREIDLLRDACYTINQSTLKGLERWM